MHNPTEDVKIRLSGLGIEKVMGLELKCFSAISICSPIGLLCFSLPYNLWKVLDNDLDAGIRASD
jgi:hypothetical protein